MEDTNSDMTLIKKKVCPD